MIIDSRKRKGIAAGMVFLAYSVFVSCTDVTLPGPKLTAPGARSAFVSGSCGATYSIVTYETDDLMAQYGIPPTQDTLSVCETWSGSDYAAEALVVGSSETSVLVPDTVQGVRYANGSVTGQAANGGNVGSPTTIGPTLFDFMYADASQRQASVDNPYYGIYAPDACPGMDVCTPLMSSSPAPSSPASGGGGLLAPSLAAMHAAAMPDTTKYRKHGLHRAGVRALVDEMNEVDPSPTGERRFRHVKRGDEITLSVDPATQLRTGEETRSKEGRVHRARHSWKKTSHGYLRIRTDTEDEEVVRGQRFLSRSTLTLRNLRINDVIIDDTPGGQP